MPLLRLVECAFIVIMAPKEHGQGDTDGHDESGEEGPEDRFLVDLVLVLLIWSVKHLRKSVEEGLNLVVANRC